MSNRVRMFMHVVELERAARAASGTSAVGGKGLPAALPAMLEMKAEKVAQMCQDWQRLMNVIEWYCDRAEDLPDSGVRAVAARDSAKGLE